MFNILLKIIPLDLGVILGSPGIIALTLVALGGKNYPKMHAFLMFLGALCTGLGIAILGYSLASSIDTGVKQNSAESIVDIIFGLFLLIYGLKIFFSHDRKISLKEEEHELKIFKWFGIGLILTILNFDSLILSFTAAKEVGNAEITTAVKWILLAINIFFFTLPITLPLILKMLFPKVADPILAKINSFMIKYGRYIILIMFLIFGIYLLYRGIKFFI